MFYFYTWLSDVNIRQQYIDQSLAHLGRLYVSELNYHWWSHASRNLLKILMISFRKLSWNLMVPGCSSVHVYGWVVSSKTIETCKHLIIMKKASRKMIYLYDYVQVIFFSLGYFIFEPRFCHNRTVIDTASVRPIWIGTDRLPPHTATLCVSEWTQATGRFTDDGRYPTIVFAIKVLLIFCDKSVTSKGMGVYFVRHEFANVH